MGNDKVPLTEGVNVGDTDPVDVPEGEEPDDGDGVPDGDFDGVTVGEIVRELDVVPDVVFDGVFDSVPVGETEGVLEAAPPVLGVPDGDPPELGVTDGVTVGEIVRELDVVPDVVFDGVFDSVPVGETEGVLEAAPPVLGVLDGVPNGVPEGDEPVVPDIDVVFVVVALPVPEGVNVRVAVSDPDAPPPDVAEPDGVKVSEPVFERVPVVVCEAVFVIDGVPEEDAVPDGVPEGDVVSAGVEDKDDPVDEVLVGVTGGVGVFDVDLVREAVGVVLLVFVVVLLAVAVLDVVPEGVNVCVSTRRAPTRRNIRSRRIRVEQDRNPSAPTSRCESRKTNLARKAPAEFSQETASGQIGR